MPVIARLESRAAGDRSGVHALLVTETVREQRAGAAAWVGRQLARGAKVYYKARPDNRSPDEEWLAGPGGAPGAEGALASGQLEIVGFPEVVHRAGGTTDGLSRLLAGEAARGLDEGWARIAMSQESPGRPMADDAEIAEFAAQEAIYDELAGRLPLTTLCQLTTVHENPAAVWETAALHFGDLLDDQWGARLGRDGWRLWGELDAHVVTRFAAALHGAQQAALRSGDDLHVDVSDVGFLDVAAAQSLVLAAHVAARRQQLVLRGASDEIRDMIAAVGRPRAVRFDEDRGRR